MRTISLGLSRFSQYQRSNRKISRTFIFVFGISGQAFAAILLRFYRWDGEMLLNHFFEHGKEHIYERVGVMEQGDHYFILMNDFDVIFPEILYLVEHRVRKVGWSARYKFFILFYFIDLQ